MAKKAVKSEVKKVKGIYEQPPPGSGIWWINYYENGVRHREKVGRRADALKLHGDRRADILRNRKLPEIGKSKVTLSDLIDDALEFAKTHIQHPRDFTSKADIVRPEFGNRAASEITPQEIDRWLEKRFNPSTANRYKTFLSVCYREGMRNGKVHINPARLVRKRKEDNEVIRYLSGDEYKRLSEAVERDFPDKLPELIVSVYTAMRKNEQYGIVWSQIDFENRLVKRVQTKSRSTRVVYRDVPLSLIAIDALRLHKERQNPKPTDKVFPLPGPSADFRWWFNPSLKSAGIAEYHWHCNRHTTCSWMAMAGATLKEIQAQAGHKTIAMSARYSHLSPGHQQGATALIRPPA
jgi:integrase